MRNKVLLILAMATIVGGVVAYSVASATTQRADCPGTATCPMTGQEVCKDQCPLLAPQRPDCPGKVVCPLTGELVCRDKCPVEATAAAQDVDAVPPCCCAKVCSPKAE